jgi:hypothetical protein
MDTTRLPRDFKEFLRLLESHGVEYLLIGGYAVGYYGYVRATADMDVWVSSKPDNADKVVAALREFGFDLPDLNRELFIQEGNVVRMGVPPFRLEILTSISGVDFASCYADRVRTTIDDLPVSVIRLQHLKANKKASGRLKDLVDLQHLP